MTVGRHLARGAVLGLFGGWFALSILQQLDRPRIPRKFDPLSMVVPNWRFFAPVPARHDFNVLHRVRRAGGVVTPWREESFAVPRSLVQIFWHPRRRIEKAIFDVASELFQVSRDLRDPAAIQLSVSYLALLNHLSHTVVHPDDATEVQFLIARSAEHEPELDPQLLFLSEWHRLGERRATTEGSTA